MVFFTAFGRRTELLAVAQGAAAVTEGEYKMFQQAMSEQGQSKSSTAQILMDAKKKGTKLDAWGASGGMPRAPSAKHPSM
mmetsp:Transcript_10384/g.23194  ORF Transcript_10384/g.23194 Transcript_10384/m.23194 type:complete len:80 (+) Transcript_10384:33-272(+)